MQRLFGNRMHETWNEKYRSAKMKKVTRITGDPTIITTWHFLKTELYDFYVFFAQWIII